MAELEIAEIFHDSGALRYRYARYLAPEGRRWIRHGLFFAYHENGAIASEATYEHGPRKDLHLNGQLAALGHYDRGIALEPWQYWDVDGRPET